MTECGDLESGLAVLVNVMDFSVFDPNGDEREDIAIGAPAAREAFVLSTQATELLPGFALREDAAGFGAAIATPGDLNGDGRGDLVVADASGDLRVYHHLGLDPVPVLVRAAGGPLELHSAGDVDLDGYPDILVARSASCAVQFVLGGREEPRVVSAPGASGGCSAAHALLARAVGDLDADGVADVARVHADGSVSFWNGHRDTAVGRWRGLEDMRVVRDLVSVDLLGDGSRALVLALEDELVVVGSPAEEAVVRGRTFLFPPSAGRLLADLGDVDGDGRGDVGIVTGSGYAIMFGDGLEPTSPLPLDLGSWGAPPEDQALIAGTHDLDGDGRRDVAWRAAEGVVVGFIGPDRSVRDIWWGVGRETSLELGAAIAQRAP